MQATTCLCNTTLTVTVKNGNNSSWWKINERGGIWVIIAKSKSECFISFWYIIREYLKVDSNPLNRWRECFINLSWSSKVKTIAHQCSAIKTFYCNVITQLRQLIILLDDEDFIHDCWTTSFLAEGVGCDFKANCYYCVN